MTTDNLIAGIQSAEGTAILQSVNPANQVALPEQFTVATTAEINRAAEAADEAWKIYKNTSGIKKAHFLNAIATEIETLGDVLIHRVMAETGLPEARIKGEIGRTCNQLRLFAQLVTEGSWVDAVIDEAMPGRQPLPRVDIRKMSVALGPVAIFTASNFPLAFSTAGGDTASALAAGCPVIIKAHPAHLGTNAMIAQAINQAAEKHRIPAGVFSSLQGGIETGQQLVKHPLIKAVGFTGSYQGGRALMDLANSRPKPIPVYAEMGSNNPIFILQEKLATDYKDLAEKMASSINLGVGQFCTNPGILVLQNSDTTSSFLQALQQAFNRYPAAPMLNEGVFKNYIANKRACIDTDGVKLLFEHKNQNGSWKGTPAIAEVSATQFLSNNTLQQEVFGPFTLVVSCEDDAEFIAVANTLHGQLTATLMGTSKDLAKAESLIEILTQKAGRVIFNGLPTGVEVCLAMHHGGPFPSTSSPLFTSVGTDAIKRFVRPICYQNMPEELLPAALKTGNPLNIWRTVNGQKTKT